MIFFSKFFKKNRKKIGVDSTSKCKINKNDQRNFLWRREIKF